MIVFDGNHSSHMWWLLKSPFGGVKSFYTGYCLDMLWSIAITIVPGRMCWWLMGKRVAMFLLSTICIQLVRNLNVYLCAVRCVRIEKKKGKKTLQTFSKELRCNSHTVGCNLNGTFFQQLKLIWISNSGGTILYTEFFSVKNSIPRGVGGAILYMIPK